MINNKALNKYLAHYAEEESLDLEDLFFGVTYKNVVVIPAYNESDNFIRRFINSPLAGSKVLLIIVINQPDTETNGLPQEVLNQSINQYGNQRWTRNNLTLIEIDSKLAEILVVDRYSSSRKILKKQGVGLARKIGTDIATTLIGNGNIESHWICSTDADTHLPDNYFDVLSKIPENTSAAIYDFKHDRHDDKLSEATERYEHALRYYVSGLKWAGSNYSFHTVGSCIAVKYDYYGKVRGFPKRSAGEDFYLLNKLAKLSPIRNIESATLKIEPRTSSRVPFGTGPAVSKILALDDIETFGYYHPQLFIELKNCLTELDSLWDYRDNIDSWYEKLSVYSTFALQQMPFNKLVIHIQNQALNEQQSKQQINQWFDAFRTLKFIHIIQNEYLPKLPFRIAIAKVPFSIS